MMDNKDKDHLLSLKVMRLTRPSLFTGISVTSDSRDLPGDILNNETKCDMAIPQPDTGIGQVLLLPQSFGNIYLGETFACCICVHNSSSDVVYDVSLKAVLQMSNQRVPLLDEDEGDLTHLGSDDLINKIIQHEVKEVGTHILVCAVHYKGPGGVEQSFRKFFKFQVLKPLDVKTKFYNAESEEVYLEAGIQNITSGPIFLERVTLDPAPCYSVTSLNGLVPGHGGGGDRGDNEDEEVAMRRRRRRSGEDYSVFGPIGCVNPHESRQYLFCLRPCQGKDGKGNPQVLKQTTDIGKLDIVWRTNMADKGRLQTSQLQRMVWASQYGDVKVMVEKAPSVVRLDELFHVTLSITNICERELSLHLDFLRSSSFSSSVSPSSPSSSSSSPPSSSSSSSSFCTEWHHSSTPASHHLTPLPVGQTFSVQLTLVPMKLGLQTIAGVRLTDTFLKRTYDYENLTQVFVTGDASGEREEALARWREGGGEGEGEGEGGKGL